MTAAPTPGTPAHPSAETLASFLEGSLAPATLATVAAHLRSCPSCRIVVSETARFGRGEEGVGISVGQGYGEEGDDSDVNDFEDASHHAAALSIEHHAAHPSMASAHQAARRASRWRWLAVAAAIALVALLIPLLRPHSGVDTLIAAAPRDHRVVEARLSGFPWARLQGLPRGTPLPDPADLKLSGAAGKVLESTLSRQTAEAHHARGTALLLIASNAEAVKELELAARGSDDTRAADDARGSNDPRIWNDLAAARYALGAYPPALAAADRALALAPGRPEPLFNRALILERLAGRAPARAAWQQYLAADATSPWAAEARARLRHLAE
ncbi:MAG: Tetratricopeptide repeat protein [Acidobacteria bacterium]|nr:Tetratricopeptide repeat protein [Acidobacteriota bacterium]